MYMTAGYYKNNIKTKKKPKQINCWKDQRHSGVYNIIFWNDSSNTNVFVHIWNI